MKFNFKKTLLILILVLTLSFGLVGCQKENVEANKKAINSNTLSIAELQKSVEAIKAGKVDSEQLATLKAELEETMATFATKEALENEKAEREAKLAEVDAQLETLATKEALAAEKAALEARIAEVEAQGADYATKEALENEKVALEARIASLENSSATKEALAAEKAALEGRIATLEEKLETLATASDLGKVVSAIEAINDKVAFLEEATVNHDAYFHVTQILAGDADLTEEEQAAWDAYLAKVEAYAKAVGSYDEDAFAEFADLAPFAYNTFTAIEQFVPVYNYHETVLRPIAEEILNIWQFYLFRTTQFAQLEEYFTAIVDELAAAETLEDTFHRLVNEFGLVTVDVFDDESELVKQIADLESAYAQLQEVEIIDKDRFAEDEKEYEAIIAARDNLFAVKEFVNDQAEGALDDEFPLYEHKENYKALQEIVDSVDDEEYFGVWEAEEGANAEEIAKVEAHNAMVARYPEGYGKKDVFADFFDKLESFMTRLAKLEEAYAALDAGVLPECEEYPVYNTTRYNSVVEDYEGVVAWAEEFELEEENRDYIYEAKTGQPFTKQEPTVVINEETGEEETVESKLDATSVYEFVKELDALVKEYVEDIELDSRVKGLVEAEYLEYTEKAAVEKAEADLAALKEAIADEKQYAAVCDAFGMVLETTVNQKGFDQVSARIDELDTLAEEIAELLAFVKSFKVYEDENDEEGHYEVDIEDFEVLFGAEESVRSELNYMYRVNEIERYDFDEPEELSHNRLMTKEIEEELRKAAQAYELDVAELREAAEAARKLLTEEVMKYPLVWANDIEEAIVRVGYMIFKYNIANKDVALSAEGDLENFSELLEELGRVEEIATYEAIEAENEYAAIIEDREAIAEVNPEAVKLDEVTAVLTAFMDVELWAEAYFGEENIVVYKEVKDEATGEVEQVVDLEASLAKLVEYYGKVQTINTLDINYQDGSEEVTELDHYEINGVRYDFYTMAEVEHAINCYLATLTLLDEAEAAWAEVKVLLEAALAIEPWTYHDKAQFDEASAAYKAFRTTYYNSEELCDMAGEAELREQFEEAYSRFNEFYANAMIDAAAINAAIAELPTHAIIVDNVDQLESAYEEARANVEAIDAILVMIDNFDQKYDSVEYDEGTVCHELFGGKAGNMLTLMRYSYSVQGVLLIEKVAEGYQKQAVEHYKTYVARFIYSSAKDIDKAKTFYSTYESLLEGFMQA